MTLQELAKQHEATPDEVWLVRQASGGPTLRLADDAWTYPGRPQAYHFSAAERAADDWVRIK